MSQSASVWIVVLSLIGVYYAQQLQAPTENYPYSASLATNYMLYWKYNDTYITFETHVDAQGYTGFGISANGSMFPGDMIVGYVVHNKATLKDYYADKHGPLNVDSSQDWTLIDGKKVGTVTILKFSRALNTHDDNDIAIHPGVTHVIWSYSDSDPTNVAYHHANRGSQDIKLIDKNTVPVGK